MKILTKSQAEVDELNRKQQSGETHWTCSTHEQALLVATKDGWECPHPQCNLAVSY